MNYFIIIWSTFMITLVPNLSHATFLAEPYAGYEAGNFNFEKLASENTFNSAKGTLHGLGVGLRLKYQFTLFNFGFDANYASLEQNIEEQNDSYVASRQSFYLTSGIDTGYFSFYLGYAPMSSLTVKGTSESIYSGVTEKAGLSLLVLKYTRLNLEYAQHRLKELKLGSSTYTLKDHFKEVAYGHYSLNVAFIF